MGKDADKPPMPPPPPPPADEKESSTEDWTGEPSEEENGPAKSVTDVAKEVLAGEWGEGQERRIALANAGFDPNQVKDEMLRIVNDKT